MATLQLTDLETASAAVVVVRRSDGGVALGFGIESNGDLELVLSDVDARRLADTIASVLGERA